MGNHGYTAARGVVQSCDEEGLWLRLDDGRELRAAFPLASDYARTGHEVIVAGAASPQGYVADMLTNQSTRETWNRYAYRNLTWFDAAKLTFSWAHLRAMILMFIPIVNLFFGSFLGLMALVLAWRVRSLLRTVGLFLLWTLGTAALMGIATYQDKRAFEGMMLLWYLIVFPLTYVIVMASIEKGADERNGEAHRGMERAVAMLSDRRAELTT